MSPPESKAPSSIFRRKSDGKIVVRKDGRILVVYENVGELVETHLKGLELKEDNAKKT